MSNIAKGCAAFVIGLFITALFGYNLFYIPLIAFFLAAVLVFIFNRRIPVNIKKLLNIKRLWLCFLIAAIGSCFFGFHAVVVYQQAILCAETTAEVHGVLKEKIEYDGGNRCYIVGVSKIGEKNFLIPFNLKLYTNEQIDINYKDELTAKASLARVTDEDELYIFSSDASKANYLQGKITGDIMVTPRFSLTAVFLNLRDSLIESVNTWIGKPQSAVINGILFGKSDGMPYKLRRAADRCGVAHIFAVSGLHVTILSAVLMYIFKGFKIKEKLSSIILIGVLFCFAAIVGFTVSALRACIMAAISSFAILFNKRISGLQTVFVAAAIILALSPQVALGLSFMLSFLSCLGILLFSDKIFRWIRDRFELYKSYQISIINMLSVSIAAAVASSPVLLIAFGKISIVSPFVNILIMPFVPIIFISGMMTAFLGLFFPSVAAIIGYFCEGLCGGLFSCIEVISKFPLCCLPAKYSFVPLVLICCAVFIFVVMSYERNLIKPRIAAFFCAVIIVVPSVTNIAITKSLCTVTVIGNGYGSSVVITADGRTIIINCGGGYNSGRNVCQFLDSRGIKKVDFLIFTATNNQHMKGADTIFEVMPVLCMIIPKEAEYTELNQLAAKQGTKVSFADDSHIEYSMVTVDMDKTTKSLAMSVDVGGICFGYSDNVSALTAIAKSRYINVAFIDNEFWGWHGDLKTGFNIVLNDQDFTPDNSFVVLPDVSKEFVISGGKLKEGWL